MGLIKAGLGAAGGVMADQWKEFFYCDSIAKDTLVVKGQKRTSSRSSNTKGNENIISNGSVIAVADGQCMIIVEQGKIVEVCAEPGEFVYDTSTEPSIFTGKLGKGIIDTFKQIGKRFTFGGDPGKDQRVYYFNTKEIIDNKFGTMNPVPFRVVDSKIGFDLDLDIRCSGVYSYKITDPLLFYTNVCGNVSEPYKRTEIDTQLKTEFIHALNPGFAKLSELELRPNQISGHVDDLTNAMNDALTAKWSDLRGISIVSIALNPIVLTEEDAATLKEAQRRGMLARNPSMAGATIIDSQAEAMKAAASNEAGAMTGFMGMGMAMNANGGPAAAQSFFNMGQQQQQQQQQQQPAPQAPAANGWKCAKCGATATGKFCPECGAPKPAENGWTCKCGAVNKGKFCQECGSPKPAGAPLYKCDKCGWEPKDPHNPPKFCPECGDPFDSNDIV